MTRDEAEGFGYICGHAAWGTEDNSGIPAINTHGPFRAAFRHGFRLGESDARKKLCQITGSNFKAPLHLKPGKGRTVPAWGCLSKAKT